MWGAEFGAQGIISDITRAGSDIAGDTLSVTTIAGDVAITIRDIAGDMGEPDWVQVAIFAMLPVSPPMSPSLW